MKSALKLCSASSRIRAPIPNFLSRGRGYFYSPPLPVMGHFHPLFITSEGITPCQFRTANPSQDLSVTSNAKRPLSGVGKVPKTMGQSLWIISDKPQTFYKCCMNENCQLTIKEYLCWVSFWFVIFPWKETEFNATFTLTHRYTLRGTIFFRFRERGHFIPQLHPAPILIGQIWNFAAYQNRFCSLTRRLK